MDMFYPISNEMEPDHLCGQAPFTSMRHHDPVPLYFIAPYIQIL